MMSKACTISLLLVGLSAASVLGSAIKGQPQAQPVQRLEEQAVRAVKSPVQQHSDRSPKSSGAVSAQQQPSAPVLESSKKVYNDESLRVRSVQQPAQVAEQAAIKSAPVSASASAPVPVAVESVAAPVVEPVQPAAAPAPVVKESAPVVPPQVPIVGQAQPVAPVASPPVVEGIKPTFVEQPAGVAAPAAAAPVQPGVPVRVEGLPAQSERSAPIKEEVVVVAPIKPSVVVVEQVVPAKAAAVEPQQAPAASVIKPIEPVAPIMVQPAEPIKPVEADSQLMAKKDEPVAVAVAKEAAEPIEVPAPDPGLVLSEPIDSTTKLLIDLDEHVQKFLPAEDKQEPVVPAKNQVLVSGVDYSPAEAQPSGKSSVPLVPYSSSSASVDTEPIVPPLPSLEKVEKATGAQSSPAGAAAAAAGSSIGQSATRQANHQHQNQQQIITQLLDQLDSLQNRIQDTINQLVARRRYVMSALLRPMGTYVRRVRTNLERLQNRVNQLQAAAVSVGNNNNQNRPNGFVDAAAIETIRRRIDDISKRISDIVNRIRFSLTPTSAPLNNGR